MEFAINNPIFVDVYVAKIPNNFKINAVYCKERQNEIDLVLSGKVRTEKYFVWKLLEYAISRTFGEKIENIKFEKSEAGKWKCDKCEFSLTHSDGVVAVAVSEKPVGVDLQVEFLKENDSLAKRILSEIEISEYEILTADKKAEYLLTKWTEKEALFKKLDKSNFLKENSNGLAGNVKTFTVEFDGKKYSLSVATDNVENIRLYDNVSL